MFVMIYYKQLLDITVCALVVTSSVEPVHHSPVLCICYLANMSKSGSFTLVLTVICLSVIRGRHRIEDR